MRVWLVGGWLVVHCGLNVCALHSSFKPNLFYFGHYCGRFFVADSSTFTVSECCNIMRKGEEFNTKGIDILAAMLGLYRQTFHSVN